MPVTESLKLNKNLIRKNSVAYATGFFLYPYKITNLAYDNKNCLVFVFMRVYGMEAYCLCGDFLQH